MEEDYLNFLDKEYLLPDDVDSLSYFNKIETSLTVRNFEKWKSMKIVCDSFHFFLIVRLEWRTL
jgi:hypothetical protein